MLSALSTVAYISATTFAPPVRRAWPIAAQPHQPARQRLDPQPLHDRRDEHHARVADDPLIAELHPQTVQSDGLVILHPQGDLRQNRPTAPVDQG